MKKLLLLSILLTMTATGCILTARNTNTQSIEQGTDTVATKVAAVPEYPVPATARCLMAAYPEQHFTYRSDSLFFADGTAIVFDDHKEKSFEEMLDHSDVEDMFSMSYDTSSEPAYLADAGRSRCEALFKKMYGNSEGEARRNLVKVDWFGQSVPVTKVNGASEQLMKVRDELAAYPELRKYLTQASSFYWRKVRGAERQSAHSYGIAVDINTSFSNYWLWENKGATETATIKYSNRIPEEIVRVFEKFGFIWGGRWYHFDTMHFEYRPEILLYNDNRQVETE